MNNIREATIDAIISNLIMANEIEPVIPSKVPFVMNKLANLNDDMLELLFVDSIIRYNDYLKTRACMDRCYYTTKDKIL